MSKLRLAILFGGRSTEHEVSIQSARNIYEAADRSKYDLVLIGIDHEGQWHVLDAPKLLATKDDPLAKVEATHEKMSVVPGSQRELIMSGGEIGPIDVMFPVLHGPLGEDGTVQGLLKLAGIPFVGSDVLGSAVGMDKDVQKRLLRDAGIAAAKFLSIRRAHVPDFTAVKSQLGLPAFLKPANAGSSVGVRKVNSEKEWQEALEHAFQFDHKLVVEEMIQGREIECAVLGNDHPQASVPGEVITSHEFYSYEAKYLDENGAQLKIPAELSADETKQIQAAAIDVF